MIITKIKTFVSHNGFITIKFKNPIEVNEYRDEKSGKFIIDATKTLGFKSEGESKKHAVQEFGLDILYKGKFVLTLTEKFTGVYAQQMNPDQMSYIDIEQTENSVNEFFDFFKTEIKEVQNDI